MKQIKQLLIGFPEYYLLILTIMAGYKFPFTFEPIVLGFTIIPLFQIITKHKISGLIIAFLFLLLNFYLLGALLSELHEFSAFNSKAKQLLIGGLTFWFLNIFISSLMIYKYTRPSKDIPLSLHTWNNQNLLS